MTKTLSELIDRAYDIKVALSLTSYRMFHYEDGSHVEFKTTHISNLALLLKLAGGLPIQIVAGESYLIIRVHERDEEDET